MLNRALRRRPSPSMAVSLVALFVSLGGAGYAATGGNFILGQANTAGKTSGLGSGVTTGPTLAVKNTGGKPAASFTGGTGAAPFTVNSGTKVANLNADLLDGLDSRAFTTGTGSNSWGGAAVAAGTSSVFAGASGTRGYRLQYTCPLSPAPGSWDVFNTSSTDAFELLAYDV